MANLHNVFLCGLMRDIGWTLSSLSHTSASTRKFARSETVT